MFVNFRAGIETDENNSSSDEMLDEFLTSQATKKNCVFSLVKHPWISKKADGFYCKICSETFIGRGSWITVPISKKNNKKH